MILSLNFLFYQNCYFQPNPDINGDNTHSNLASQKRALIIRHQVFWNQRQLKLKESSANLVEVFFGTFSMHNRNDFTAFD